VGNGGTERDVSQGLGSGTLLPVVATVVTSAFLHVYVKYIDTGYLAASMQERVAGEHHISSWCILSSSRETNAWKPAW
jgi:hypothetical protein